MYCCLSQEVDSKHTWTATAQIILYDNNPKFWDRQAWANSEDPDQTLETVASDQVYTVCYSSNTFLDTSVGSKMDLFKF